MNAAKSAVARPEERHFLGFRLRREPSDGSVEVRLSRRSLDRLAESIRSRTPRNWGRSLRDAIGGLNGYLRGWISFFGICSLSERVHLHRMDGHIRRRLRAIVLRHWKRKRTIARNLIKLGLRPATARRAVYQEQRSWWALSQTKAIQHALPNRRFAAQGLRSLVAMWQDLQPALVAAPGQLSLDLG